MELKKNKEISSNQETAIFTPETESKSRIGEYDPIEGEFTHGRVWFYL